MDQELDLSALNGQQLDPDVFRQVWNRVMPDQTNCPLAIVPPAPSPIQSVSAPLPAPEADFCLGVASQSYSLTLHTLMDQAQDWLSALLPLTRRNRTLSAAAVDLRRCLRQLSAAHFLITGQRYRPAPPQSAAVSSFQLALRDQFFRAKHWERHCRQAAAETGDPCLRELYEELAQLGTLHAGHIRSILEQM